MIVAYEENANFPAFMFIRELSVLEDNIHYSQTDLNDRFLKTVLWLFSSESVTILLGTQICDFRIMTMFIFSPFYSTQEGGNSNKQLVNKHT